MGSAWPRLPAACCRGGATARGSLSFRAVACPTPGAHASPSHLAGAEASGQGRWVASLASAFPWSRKPRESSPLLSVCTNGNPSRPLTPICGAAFLSPPAAAALPAAPLGRPAPSPEPQWLVPGDAGKAASAALTSHFRCGRALCGCSSPAGAQARLGAGGHNAQTRPLAQDGGGG